MRSLQLPSEQTSLALGMGTWLMGKSARNRQELLIRDFSSHSFDLTALIFAL